MKRLFIFTALLLMLSVSAFSQSVPQTLHFQGRLAKPDGTPVPDTTTQTLTFRLYDAVTNGNKLWEQVSNNVAVHNGTFAARFDFSTGYQNGNTLASVFGNALFTPFLEVKVGTDTPLTPRQPLSSAAYALYAGTALTVPDGSIKLPKLASGVLSFSNLTGSLSLNQIPDGLITGSKIAAGTIGSSNLTTDIQAILAKLTVASGPNILVALGSVGTGDGTASVAIAGSTAYVVNSVSNTLEVFDVSNPASPTLKGSIGTGISPISVAVQGSFAYVVNISNSLQVFDVSNPSSPALRGSIGTDSKPYTVAIQGNIVYVVNYSGKTLQTFSTTATSYLQVLGDVSIAGNVGIGTTTPAYKLDVVGDINASGKVRSAGVELTSDARYKQNITTFNNALDAILNLHGVTFDWNRDAWKDKNFPEGRQIGFIAQEIEKVLPELVSTDKNGYKSVAYANVVPVLVEAVKTLKSQLDDKQKQIDELKAQLKQRSSQQEQIDDLRQQLATLLTTLKQNVVPPK